MGAQYINAFIDGQATEDEIDSWLSNQQDEDNSYNGHQEGYSGDWQTVSGIVLVKNPLFNSLDQAEEYIQDNAVKWQNGIACYYYSPDGITINTVLGCWAAC